MPLAPDLVERAIRAHRLLDAPALAHARDAARRADTSLAEYMVAQHLVSEPELSHAIAAAIGVPFVDLRTETIDPSVLARIPHPVAVHRRAVAYAATPTTLSVALEDPDDLETIAAIERSTGLTVVPALATSAAITDALRMYQPDVRASVEAIAALTAQPESHDPERASRDLQKLAEEVSVVRIIDTLLQHAINLRASDIHLEPAERDVQVRFRIDGILQPTMTLPKALAPGLVARIKILANLKIDEHRLPQDGRFKVTTPAERLAVRVAIMPVYDGEKVVLRLLREQGKTLTLTDLGLRAEMLGEPVAPLAIAERNMHKPHGVLFVTGPTGCGKTTTLYAMLQELNTPAVNIATIEDPIEYRMPGVNQSQVHARIGFTFAAGLRELLRQDPNIIMVGEIRDNETADIAVNAALTGHLVLATLHTNDAATAVTRLEEMGVPTFLVASTMNAILAQRLVRRRCAACRKLDRMPAALAEQLEARGAELTRALALAGHLPASPPRPTARTLPYWVAPGCAECRNEGYRGRIGIYEVLEVSSDIAAKIHARATHDELRDAAVAAGMTTMFADGIVKAAAGMTSVEEVLRVTRE